MVLKLSIEHQKTIESHAESTYPDECCGLLLGHRTDAEQTLVEVWPTENVWSAEAAADFGAQRSHSKKRHYTIAPEVMLRAQKQARDRNLAVIGIYHSHPDHPAIPSEFDREYAWPEYAYIIVSVHQGKVVDFRNWSLDETHQFRAEEILSL